MVYHPQEHQLDPLHEPVAVIGSGLAGLITAYTLLQDGFANVEILTRDKSVGGVWSEERVYPGLCINSVHGEYRFSPLPMRVPESHTKTGGRLSGDNIRQYLEEFKERFLKGKIRFETEVLNIRRGDGGRGWSVLVHDKNSASAEKVRVLYYPRIVLCTGGNSNPYFPESLAPEAAKAARFSGPVFHSMDFASRIDDLLSCTAPTGPDAPREVVVVGSGKSAQDAAAFLANEGRPVTVIFRIADAFLASPNPLPDAIRKSRLLSVMAGDKELRSRLERFLHTTWIGGLIVRGFWQTLARYSHHVLGLPRDSPLRCTRSIFWNTRTNDEGVPREGSFYSLVNAGKITIVSPAQVEKYGDDGQSVVLDDGRTVPASAVILATGYKSTWRPIFDDETIEYLGLGRRPPGYEPRKKYHWDYTSLANPPAIPRDAPWVAPVYRALVPAKSMLNRDFAINGATLSTHHAYISELSAHWIAAYFRRDELRLPRSVDEALDLADRDAAWVRRRYPYTQNWTSESNATGICFWSWPQLADNLLEDMGLPARRSGGNWLTWPFKPMDIDHLAHLKEEREAKRRSSTT
ncbi:FAD/NAD-P-binding domain-containing protein [Lactarius akahatsu]|uniref:FAD/NAD-P-binding domain-containing protein n=1 Tax=Lactarius akahatsu TaxID=416441 RepID=A0AAD4LH50_9AGAM|nr:FAD/NAD-P-binding domain-containing protein [Lactarius akahatsu]